MKLVNFASTIAFAFHLIGAKSNNGNRKVISESKQTVLTLGEITMLDVEDYDWTQGDRKSVCREKISQAGLGQLTFEKLPDLLTPFHKKLFEDSNYMDEYIKACLEPMNEYFVGKYGGMLSGPSDLDCEDKIFTMLKMVGFFYPGGALESAELAEAMS